MKPCLNEELSLDIEIANIEEPKDGSPFHSVDIKIYISDMEYENELVGEFSVLEGNGIGIPIDFSINVTAKVKPDEPQEINII